ncbi:hypothetical protein ABLE93_22755 [Xanthobacter sp. KR7-65]|uniref:hypothetical protein n=1 Tax=Xanthobacter sp. KR7-65 TaxID=3156612 RepID=UPI0032B601B4
MHVHAADRAVVRAAYGKIAAPHRHDPAKREARKAFYRRMLDEHRRRQDLVLVLRL